MENKKITITMGPWPYGLLEINHKYYQYGIIKYNQAERCYEKEDDAVNLEHIARSILCEKNKNVKNFIFPNIIPQAFILLKIDSTENTYGIAKYDYDFDYYVEHDYGPYTKEKATSLIKRYKFKITIPKPFTIVGPLIDDYGYHLMKYNYAKKGYENFDNCIYTLQEINELNDDVLSELNASECFDVNYK